MSLLRSPGNSRHRGGLGPEHAVPNTRRRRGRSASVRRLLHMPSWRGIRLGPCSGLRSLAAGPLLPTCLQGLDGLFAGGMAALALQRHASTDICTMQAFFLVCADAPHYDLIHSLDRYQEVPLLLSWLGGFVPMASWTAAATTVLLQTSYDNPVAGTEVFAGAAWYTARLLRQLVSRASIGVIGHRLESRAVLGCIVSMVDVSCESEKPVRKLQRNYPRTMWLQSASRTHKDAGGRPIADDLISLGKTFQVAGLTIAAGRMGEWTTDSDIGRRLCGSSARRCGSNQGNPQNDGSLYHQSSVEFRCDQSIQPFEPRPTAWCPTGCGLLMRTCVTPRPSGPRVSTKLTWARLPRSLQVRPRASGRCATSTLGPLRQRGMPRR